jgi:hypothetical protein
LLDMQKPHVTKAKLLASYLMIGVLSLVLAELLERQFRRTFSNTYTRAIVPAPTLAALEPDIFPFAFLFSHKN